MAHRWLLWSIVLPPAALLAIYARLAGLGTWPLAADEHYMGESVRLILDGGLPAFPCGGFYVRGLPQQYLAALLVSAGLSMELALRSVSALSGLLVLPAMYLVARRLGGHPLATALVLILGLSTWEVEMSRFGRMYAPFQAIFAWYLFFAVRSRVDDHAPSRWLALALSVLGLVTWEGGVFLLLFNLLLMPEDERKARRLGAQRSFWTVAGGILLFGVLYARTDFRRIGVVDALPAGYVPGPGRPGRLHDALELWGALGGHPLWWMAWLILGVLASAWLSRMARSGRARPVEIVVLAAFLLAGAAGTWLAAATGLVVGMLLGWLRPRQMSRTDRAVVAALAVASVLLWVAFIVATHGAGPASGLKLLLRAAFKLPDMWDRFLGLWLEVMPGLTLIVLGLAGVAILRSSILEDDSDANRTVRYLGAVLLLGLLLVGASTSSSDETRYSFFLYPVMILLALVGGGAIVTALGRRELAATAAGLLCLAWFGGEDFNLRHLAQVSSAEVNFRVALAEPLRRHFYPRYDYLGVSAFVDAHARPSELVITSMLPTAWYLKRLDYVYIDERDARFPQQACRGGRVHVWSGKPLVHSMQALSEVTARSRVAWLITSSNPELREALERSFDVELRYRDISGALVAYELAQR